MTDCGECANFKPKKEQMGWVCNVCTSFQEHVCVSLGDNKPCACTGGRRGGVRSGVDWRPFYGKVVE